MTNVLSQPTTIDVDELQGMLANHLPVTVLDVRRSDERAEWAIPGSIHVDAYEDLQAGRAPPSRRWTCRAASPW